MVTALFSLCESNRVVFKFALVLFWMTENKCTGTYYFWSYTRGDLAGGRSLTKRGRTVNIKNTQGKKSKWSVGQASTHMAFTLPMAHGILISPVNACVCVCVCCQGLGQLAT